MKSSSDENGLRGVLTVAEQLRVTYTTNPRYNVASLYDGSLTFISWYPFHGALDAPSAERNSGAYIHPVFPTDVVNW